MASLSSDLALSNAPSAQITARANSGPRLGLRGLEPLSLLSAIIIICLEVRLALVSTPAIRPLLSSSGSSLNRRSYSHHSNLPHSLVGKLYSDQSLHGAPQVRGVRGHGETLQEL